MYKYINVHIETKDKQSSKTDIIKLINETNINDNKYYLNNNKRHPKKQAVLQSSGSELERAVRVQIDSHRRQSSGPYSLWRVQQSLSWSPRRIVSKSEAQMKNL